MLRDSAAGRTVAVTAKNSLFTKPVVVLKGIAMQHPYGMSQAPPNLEPVSILLCLLTRKH
jgi:hypothetical protein